MSYFKDGVRKRGFVKVLKPSAAETTSSDHGVANTKSRSSSVVTVDVTDASGTSPTLIVVVEGSGDGGVTWTELGRIGSDGYSVGPLATAPSSITGAGQHRGVYPAMQWLRTRSVVGGSSPSFTYNVLAEIR